MVSVPVTVLLLCLSLTQAHLRARTFIPLGSRTTEFYVDSAPHVNRVGLGVDVGPFGGNAVHDVTEDRKDPRCLFCRVGRGKRSLHA